MIQKLWVLPCSIIGYAVRLFCGPIVTSYHETGDTLTIVRWMFPWADAITFGEIILVRTGHYSDAIFRHEFTHVNQYRKWGLLFFVIYGGNFLYNLIKYRNYNDAYMNIYFEQQAYMAEWMVTQEERDE